MHDDDDDYDDVILVQALNYAVHFIVAFFKSDILNT